ncbi:MAG: hypothetical protein J0I10_07285 [Verrucomicrobia bacterium]|nr:hypothetical protein [Verrucomicrobiota bacterium]
MTRLSPCLGVLALLLSLASRASADFDRSELQRAKPEIRQHFDSFPLFPFEYDANGWAVIRLLDTSKNSFVFEQGRYFGFRFKTPGEITGSFSWFFLMSNPDRQIIMQDFAWYITRKGGEMTGFKNYTPDELAKYPRLSARFPNTQGIIYQNLDGRNLLPNEEYLIWFRVPSDDILPPLAVAFALPNPGRYPRSRLPLVGEPIPGSAKPVPPRSSIEGDPW